MRLRCILVASLAPLIPLQPAIFPNSSLLISLSRYIQFFDRICILSVVFCKVRSLNEESYYWFLQSLGHYLGKLPLQRLR